MAYDLLPVIDETRPLPEIDIETISTGFVEVPPEATLSTFLHLETALARFAAGFTDLLPADPAAERLTVYSTAAHGATLAVVPRDVPALEQLRRAMEPAISAPEISSPEALGTGRALVFPFRPALRIRYEPRIRFRLHWLREEAAGSVEGALGRLAGTEVRARLLGTVADDFQAAVTLDENRWLRLRIVKKGESCPDSLSSFQVEPQGAAPAPPRPDPLLLALLDSGGGTAEEPVQPLAEQAYAQAPRALANKYAVALQRRQAAQTVMVDCSFAFSSEGLAAYRGALEGEIPMQSSAHIHVRPAALTGELDEQSAVDLLLPFFDRKLWPSRWKMLANAGLETGEDGRLTAYTAADRISQKNEIQSTVALAAALFNLRELADFDLSFTDTRAGEAGHMAHMLAPVLAALNFPSGTAEWIKEAIAAGGTLESSITLRLPGTAMEAWLRAPAERDPDFFDTYQKASVAVQQATRRWLPFAYFSDPVRYEDPQGAYPLIFFQSTRHRSGKPRSDFAYDLISPDTPGVAKPWAARPFSAELGKVREMLVAEGRAQLGKLYSAWRAGDILAGMVRQPRAINTLLAADAFLVGHMVKLGLEAKTLADALAKDRRRAARDLVRFALDSAAAITRRLRRLYGGLDCTGFAALYLIEATRALAVAQGGSVGISATFRVKAGGREQTFLNAA